MMNKNTIRYISNENTMQIDFKETFNIDSVDTLIQLIHMGFGYYKYPEITLTLDSPGGDIKAMKKLLKVFQEHQKVGQHLRIRAGALCASAAAVVLTLSTWGTRKVERDTLLLFHWGRTLLPSGQVITSESANTLVKHLDFHNQKILNLIMQNLFNNTGGTDALIRTMQFRVSEVCSQWKHLSEMLEEVVDKKKDVPTPTLQLLNQHLQRWHQTKNKETKETKEVKIIDLIRDRFEQDTTMDLREAYALCLIDQVDGVLPLAASKVTDNDFTDEDDTSAAEVPVMCG